MTTYLKTAGRISLYATLALSVSCTNFSRSDSEVMPAKEDVSQVATVNKTHYAFAGGGWRAHSGHTAWLSSQIEPGVRDISGFFENVGTVSSNSGGSWFSTMAIYDSTFNTAINSGHSTFWIDGQRAAFSAQTPTICSDLGEVDNTYCILVKKYKLDWRAFVEGVAYQNSSIKDSMTLSSPSMPWASNTSFLLAGTLLTHDAVFDGSFWGDKAYYWACPTGSFPFLEWSNDGYKGGKCNPNSVVPDVIPVTFSNKVASTTVGATPEFLKGTSPLYNLGYAVNSFSGSPIGTTKISNPLVTDQVKILDAASASSAAAGYASSHNVSKDWIESYEAENLAIDFQLQGGAVKQIDPPMDFSEFSTRQMIKIADGGAIDNTGVAQLMSFLQESKQDHNFSIVSFDSYLVAFEKDVFGSWTTTTYGKDGLSDGMRYLIGDLATPDPYEFDGYKITLPDMQVFDVTTRGQSSGASFDNPSCPQNGSGDGSSGKVFISILSVTTRDNPAFGVKAGSKGIIVVLASENSAPTAPTDPKSFDCYTEMVRNMSAFIANDTVFSSQLEAALTKTAFE